MKASELLRKSADLIREDGWLQGGFGDPRRGFCADGAMIFADRHDYVPYVLQDARHYFMRSLGVEHRLSLNDQVIRWNDDKSRTKRQVLANFKKAARLAESEGK